MINLTTILCVIIGLVSWQGFRDSAFFYRWMHHPFEESRKKQYERWITSGFLHRDLTHLLINVLVLWSFGTYVESFYASVFPLVVGKLLFVLLFVVSVLAGNVPSYLKHRNNPSYSAIGASAGVSGVLFTSILLQPWAPVLLFAVIPIWGIVFGVMYLAYEYYAAKKLQDNIGHDAHIWGAIAGMVFTLIAYPGTLGIFLREFSRYLPF